MALAMCATLASAATAMNEMAPFLADAGAATSFAAIVPSSSFSANIRLRDCAQAINSAQVRMLPEDERIAVNRQCRGLALDLAARNPAMALAWCVAAATSAEIGDGPAFEQQLLECQRTAPHELWLSAMRFDLARAKDAMYEPSLRTAVVRDIATLLGSHRGRQMVAKACAAEPLLLALVAAAQGAATPDERAAFDAALDKAKGAP